VSGGALTSAFLTPLTLGVAQAVAATSPSGGQPILVNGFGIIAFIQLPIDCCTIFRYSV